MSENESNTPSLSASGGNDDKDTTNITSKPEGDEIGLNWLENSKAEKMDEMYQDKEDQDTEGHENKCLWTFFRIITWTLLVFAAAFVLLGAKISVVALSKTIMAPLAVSTFLRNVRNSQIIPAVHCLVSNRNSALFLQNRYITTVENLTFNTTGTSTCGLNHLELLSLDTKKWTCFSYSDSNDGHMDLTVIVMWIILLVLYPAVDLATGFYAYIRWKNVRRSSLSWKSVIVTLVSSLCEAFGVTLFLFEVLPNMDATWCLLSFPLFMILPSFTRLYQDSKGHSTRVIAIHFVFLVSLNGLVISIFSLILSGVIPGGELNLKVIWTLPLAVLLVSATWIPSVLKLQQHGTFDSSHLEDSDGQTNKDKLEDQKRTGLRTRHKLLCSLCKCIAYPLAVFAVLLAFHGYETVLETLRHFHPACTNDIPHHYMAPYFTMNIVSTMFSPIAIWIVFTAGIQFRMTFKTHLHVSISGSFCVLLLTAIATVLLAISDIPCLVYQPTSCCSGVSSLKMIMIASLVILQLLGNVPVIFNVMTANHDIFIPVHKVFMLATGNPVLMDPWVWLNVCPSSLHQRTETDFGSLHPKSKIYICTTMYREAEREMMKLLQSIKSINMARSPVNPLYEAHVFFDGAVRTDSEGKKTLNGFALQLLALVERTFDVDLDQCSQRSTPYGIQFKAPLSNECVEKPMIFYIHLKDNTKVKRGKRWSQIMYMAWAIEQDAEVPVEDRYVLITDGDTKFFEKGAVALLDSLVMSPDAAAVVGRVRPIITPNPLVWYQVFEYAVSFWIYKASNDTLGTDLCCSGCFTMYRATMLKEVLKDYAAQANNAQDFLMIDMGEDLWLSTLLIRSGYKLKYSSVAEVYTEVPSKLEEFFKQRRRWYLSSLAYFFFFISELKRFKFGNPHVTMPYLVYQGMLLCFPLVSTCTFGTVLAIAQSYAYMIPLVWSSVLVCVIFIAQHIFCLFFPSHIQIKASVLLSIVPSLSSFGIVVIVTMRSCQDYMDAFVAVNGTSLAANRIAVMESPVPVPTLMFTSLAAIVFFTAVLHPKEFHHILFVFIYIIGNPLGYVFLRPYILCNITDQSWGTRETASSGDKKTRSKLKNCCDAINCCRRSNSKKIQEADHEIPSQSSAENAEGCDSDHPSSILSESDSLNSSRIHHSDDVIQTEPTVTNVLTVEMDGMSLTDPVKQRMLTIYTELETSTRIYTSPTTKEDRFWESLIEMKLDNTETEAHKQTHKQVQEGLRSFQRRMLIVYFTLNALWLCFLTLFPYYFGEQIDVSGSWGRQFDILVVIGIPLVIVNLLQFVAMFIHRMGTWLFLLAQGKDKTGEIRMCCYPVRLPRTRQTSFTDDDSQDKHTSKIKSEGGFHEHKLSIVSPEGQQPESSHFQRDSLRGKANPGSLTPQNIAKGMTQLMQEKSVKALKATRGLTGSEPWLPTSGYLPRLVRSDGALQRTYTSQREGLHEKGFPV